MPLCSTSLLTTTAIRTSTFLFVKPFPSGFSIPRFKPSSAILCSASRRHSTLLRLVRSSTWNGQRVNSGTQRRLNTTKRRAMAWTCSATTNDGLVDNLVKEQIVTKPRIEQVLRLVDRHLFVLDHLPLRSAYEDSPQTLPCSATISAPHMHAMALELLHDRLKPGCSALDVGAGSGFIAACMAALVGQSGKVYAIEHAPELSQFANRNLTAFQQAIPENTACKVHVSTGDGRLGDSVNAPYDAIHVGAAAPEIPQALVDQLAPGGSMVIPVGPPHGSQRLDVVEKDSDGKVSQRTVCNVLFVPLCDRP